MTTSVQFDREHGLRVVRVAGVIQGFELLDVFQRIDVDPALPMTSRAVVDLRQANLGDITSADVRTFGSVSRFRPAVDTRMAIVATTPINFGIARMYATIHAGSLAGEVQVFHDYAEAIAWLRNEPIAHG